MKFLAVFAAILAFTAALPAHSTWTLGEISAALEDPSTNPALIPYLEAALNEIMSALWSGQQVDSVAIPLPAEVISPSPAGVDEAVITPTPVVVAEAAPAAPAAPAASSPLVQIIVNVNQQSADAVVPSPVPSPAVVPEINPSPVVVVDQPINPTPVVVVDEAIEPTPVVVVEEPSELIPVNPVDVIEVQPVPAPAPGEVNPIDVIAVGAPDVNPVDIMNPVPVNPAGEVGAIWV